MNSSGMLFVTGFFDPPQCVHLRLIENKGREFSEVLVFPKPDEKETEVSLMHRQEMTNLAVNGMYQERFSVVMSVSENAHCTFDLKDTPFTSQSKKQKSDELENVPEQVNEYISLFGLYGRKQIPEDGPNIYRYMKAHLTTQRLIHSLSVGKMAEKLAVLHGADVISCVRAALIHDCAKKNTLEEMQRICKNLTNVHGEVDYKSKNLLHGPAAAEMAREDGLIRNEKEYLSVFYHTTGRVGMSIEEMIVFLADKIEMTRKPYPLLHELRKIALNSIEKAVYMSILSTCDYLMKKGEAPSASTVATLEWLKSYE